MLYSFYQWMCFYGCLYYFYCALLEMTIIKMTNHIYPTWQIDPIYLPCVYIFYVFKYRFSKPDVAFITASKVRCEVSRFVSFNSNGFGHLYFSLHGHVFIYVTQHSTSCGYLQLINKTSLNIDFVVHRSCSSYPNVVLHGTDIGKIRKCILHCFY